jgi:hypothetical protein
MNVEGNSGSACRSVSLCCTMRPIQATVEREPWEIYAVLGCGRLAEPLQRYGVTAVFHGHAHRGTPEGETDSGIPVYNVSLPLMKRHWPDRPPCRILEMPIGNH